MKEYTGISESRTAKVVADLWSEKKGKVLLVVSTPLRAKRLAADLSFFVGENIFVMPAEEGTFLRYEAKSKEGLWERMAGLKALLSDVPGIVIAPISACLRKLPPASYYQEKEIELRCGGEYLYEELTSRLNQLGYERLPMITDPGQFSIRGAIIDVFSPDAEYPVRLEFFDQELESIRTFDIKTQRSIARIREVTLYPASEVLVNDKMLQLGWEKIHDEYQKWIGLTKIENPERAKELEKRLSQLEENIFIGKNRQVMEQNAEYFYPHTSYLWEYLNPGDMLVIEDSQRILEEAARREEEGLKEWEVLLSMGRAIPKDKEKIIRADTFWDCLKDLAKPKPNQEQVGERVLITPLPKEIPGIFVESSTAISSKQAPVYNGSMDVFVRDIKKYHTMGYEMIIACSSQDREKNLRDLLERENLTGRIVLRQGTLTSGMEFPDEKLLVLWDGDIFTTGKQKSRRKRSKKEGQVIKAFTDLSKGDFVVHESHGIGRFIDIQQLTVEGTKKDYLKIKYAGEDTLYIPVEQMDLIQKYIGSDGVAPKINKLSGPEWKRTKASAKEAILEMAQEILERSAERAALPGYAFGPDTPWQQEFEDQFPYTETEDQLRCIEEIKMDMEKPEPMDRLLCGDVGFGKTEVAARAIFKCVAEGKQAVILVPTTLLANQHYHTLTQRFEQFPFRVEMLSRFRTDKEQKIIVEKVKSGAIDVIIGTHRLLSKDVGFKDLGLLVIDEEQRFGVKHKETIKELRSHVDVLALSATPIPRTLHMSLTGIRDMSLIEDPPEERYPVQTYVLEEDELAIQEAIRKELKRGGQVYAVYNRVRGILRVARQLNKLVPEARLAVGHGQMNEGALEDVMLGFVEGEKDILLSTTIIEAGLDIPNVNTILILEADHYGLSQLYQLRGRVGRSNRLAYAYLFYRRGKTLSEAAEKRLRAIREFTELGAGFKVSMRDLEIRGAGNLLGTQQSGHMMTVGYELYIRLLEEAILTLQGKPIPAEKQDTSVELKASAYIPTEYVPDEVLKLEMYKKIADADTREEMAELEEEMKDRFGDVPATVTTLLMISLIRSLAEELAITRITEEKGKILFYVAQENPIEPIGYARLYETFGNRVEIGGRVKPLIKLATDEKQKLGDTLAFLEILKGL